MKNQTTFVGVAISLALILSYVEMLIPIQIGIPGVKIGLANLVIIVTLYCANGKKALLVSVFRVILAGFLFSNMYSVLYSLSGGIMSLLFMILVKRLKGFSVIGVSIVGGVIHNMAQIIVAMFIVENIGVITYVPMLLISGTITGMLVGIIASSIIIRMKKYMKCQ